MEETRMTLAQRAGAGGSCESLPALSEIKAGDLWRSYRRRQAALVSRYLRHIIDCAKTPAEKIVRLVAFSAIRTLNRARIRWLEQLAPGRCFERYFSLVAHCRFTHSENTRWLTTNLLTHSLCQLEPLIRMRGFGVDALVHEFVVSASMN